MRRRIEQRANLASLAASENCGREHNAEFLNVGVCCRRIAVTDATQGFWTPVGNKQLEGVLGLAVPVDFEMGNATSGAQTRINAGTMTVVNYGGFRTWGDVSSDLTSAYKVCECAADCGCAGRLGAAESPLGGFQSDWQELSIGSVGRCKCVHSVA